MTYLLFHNRNLQFAIISNTIYSTKLNFKRISNGAIANSQEANGEQHLVIKLKTLGMGVFEYTSVQRQFKTKWEVDAIVTAFLLLIIILIVRIMIIIQIK